MGCDCGATRDDYDILFSHPARAAQALISWWSRPSLQMVTRMRKRRSSSGYRKAVGRQSQERRSIPQSYCRITSCDRRFASILRVASASDSARAGGRCCFAAFAGKPVRTLGALAWSCDWTGAQTDRHTSSAKPLGGIYYNQFFFCVRKSFGILHDYASAQPTSLAGLCFSSYPGRSLLTPLNK